MGKSENVVSSCSGNKEEDQKILEPVNYIFQIPEEYIVDKLGQAFNYWLDVPVDKSEAILDCVRILQLGNFVVDDINDDSDIRRGVPTAHKVYGIPYTLNAATYTLIIALRRVLNLDHPKISYIWTKMLLEAHRGQGMEIYCKKHFICPSEAAYKKMMIQKLGAFFILPIHSMQLYSNCKENFTPLLEILCVYIQIRNDYLNLHSEENAEKNTFCEDVTKGNFTFPIIHAIRSHPKDKRILHIMKQGTKDLNILRYFVKLLEKCGSFAYTRTVLEELDMKAKDEIQRLGGNPVLLEFLDELMNWKHKTA